MQWNIFCKKTSAVLLSLVMVLSITSCDGPFPQVFDGDDEWPLTGVMTVAYTVNGYEIYVIHSDNSLWKHLIRNKTGESPALFSSKKIMNDVRAVYWAGGSWRILAHRLDGSLWLLESLFQERVKLMDNVRLVSVGFFQVLTIKTDDSLWELLCHSTNGGQPFLRDTDGKILPPKFIMSDVRHVSVVGDHALAIQNDDSLWMWEYDWETIGTQRSDPVWIMDYIAHASAGIGYSMAIDNAGALWAWGQNGTRWYTEHGDGDISHHSFGVGRLGNGTEEDTDLPVLIMEHVRKVSTSGNDTMAVRKDGGLWYWGSPMIGTLYITDSILSPIMVWDDETWRVTRHMYNQNHTGAIKSDGSLWKFVSVNAEITEIDDYYKIANGVSLVKIANDVLFMFRDFLLKTDGSLWLAVYNCYDSHLSDWQLPDELSMILPPGTVRSEFQ